MKLTELLSQLNLGNLSILLFLVLSLIEIAPIKVNPWSVLIKWIAKILGHEKLDTTMKYVYLDDNTLKFSYNKFYS